MNSNHSFEIRTTKHYVIGQGGGIPTGIDVRVLQVVNVGTKRKPQMRVEVEYQGKNYWLDVESLETRQ